MKLLLLRHATAMPGGVPGVVDDERPLTPAGQAAFRIAARGLARIVSRPDAVLTSPLVRARATAAIAARAFQRLVPAIEPALADENVNGIVMALNAHPRDATLALVGHEPLLSALLARLLGAPEGGRLAFRKGGAALIDLPDGPDALGRLIWFLPPRVLRTLGGGRRHDDGEVP